MPDGDFTPDSLALLKTERLVGDDGQLIWGDIGDRIESLRSWRLSKGALRSSLMTGSGVEERDGTGVQLRP